MRYNGVDITTIHRAISIAKEIPPGMPDRENDMIQGRGGEWLAGVRMQNSQYVVRVNVAARTREEAWEARAQLAAWAMSSGENTAMLEPTLWPGKAYDAIVSAIEPPEFKPRFAVIKVTFDIPRAVAYNVIESRSSGVGSISMVIDGTAYARPVIRQTLEKAASVLTWELDGNTFLTLRGTISAGSVVEADLRNGSVTIDGVHREDTVDYTETEWQPGFLPGRHAVTSSDSGEMEARWHNEWV